MDVEDLTGLGKLAETELANKVYDDALAPAAKELGGLARDVVKTFRLFTAPIQLAAQAQDRFGRWLEEIRSRVPEERQTEAPASIAGPALRAMVFLEDDNPLKDMFINLLSRAIDKESVGEVHPGFVKVLEQISPDECMIMFRILKGHTHVSKSQSMEIEHLQSLGLIVKEMIFERGETIKESELEHYNKSTRCGLTKYGHKFLSVCAPMGSGMDWNPTR